MIGSRSGGSIPAIISRPNRPLSRSWIMAKTGARKVQSDIVVKVSVRVVGSGGIAGRRSPLAQHVTHQ